MKWLPKDVGSLFFDEMDFYGLLYWYNDIKETNDELESKIPKKK